MHSHSHPEALGYAVLRDIRVDLATADPNIGDAGTVNGQPEGHQSRAEQTTVRVELDEPRAVADVAQVTQHDPDAVTGAEKFEPGVVIIDSVMRGARIPHASVEAK